VLDDVVWFGAQEGQRGRYVAGLGERQIEFIRNYLRQVNRNDLIVLLMHIPMWEWPDAERRQVFDALAPFANTLSFSAHTHVQMHRFFGAEAGWKGRTPHHHINAVTVCGSWWTGAPDPVGIPHTTMRDGTPNGYLWRRSGATAPMCATKRRTDPPTTRCTSTRSTKLTAPNSLRRPCW
jgi:hypothetical protein